MADSDSPHLNWRKPIRGHLAGISLATKLGGTKSLVTKYGGATFLATKLGGVKSLAAKLGGAKSLATKLPIILNLFLCLSLCLL